MLLVNPIRDGLNLVAKEGPLRQRARRRRSCCRPRPGAWDELGDAGAIGVNPFDVAATADALARGAVDAAPTSAAPRAASLRAVAGARTPADWLADQLAGRGRARRQRAPDPELDCTTVRVVMEFG